MGGVAQGVGSGGWASGSYVPTLSWWRFCSRDAHMPNSLLITYMFSGVI